MRIVFWLLFVSFDPDVFFDGNRFLPDRSFFVKGQPLKKMTKELIAAFFIMFVSASSKKSGQLRLGDRDSGKPEYFQHIRILVGQSNANLSQHIVIVYFDWMLCCGIFFKRAPEKNDKTVQKGV